MPDLATAARREMPETPLLEFRGVDTHYGDLHVLKAVDYRIDPGEIVCLLGGNASGKSTTMKAIMGVVVPSAGDILYQGRSLAGVSVAERVRRGIATEPFPISQGQQHLEVTISIGIASLANASDTAGDILKRADQALYRAKRDGRNRVVADAA